MATIEIISNEDYDFMKGKQDNTKEILDHEISRLKGKKDNMDTEKFNSERMLLINQSFRDKQRKYIILLTLFLLIFGITLAIVFLQNKMGMTSFIMDLLIVFVIGIGFISAYYLYKDILIRDKIDFSKHGENSLLSVNDIKNKNNKDDEKDNITNITTELCKGNSCCGPGFEYSEVNNRCESTVS